MTNGTMTDQATATEDRLVLIAAIGNSMLALPGLFGTYMAYGSLSMEWRRALRNSEHVWAALSETAFFTTLIGVGFLLLCGYWLAYGGRLRPRVRQPLWWGSVVYNGILTAYLWWMALSLANKAIQADDRSAEFITTFLIFETVVLALACWTGFMAWLSIPQAQAG